MGITKLCAESIIKKAGEKFVAVRFGNVMGSRGSLLPIWQRQMDKGEPLTVTDKRMTRYMMTIPEAVSLVIEAGEKGKNGETWILNMGKQVNILELANKILGKEGKVKMIGIRNGETLDEKLMTLEEEQRAKLVGNFYIV
jgi:FlaA1/EpsC-like NDP-sugar epimerase